MISAEDFAAQWAVPVSNGEDNRWFARWGSYELARYDTDAVSGLNISDASKTFLTQAGLPRKAYRGVFQFGGVFASLPRLEDVQPRVGKRYLHERYRVLGGIAFLYNNQTLYDHFICLQDKSEEQICMVESTEEFLVRPVNSSVSQLAEFLLLLRNDTDDALLCERTLRRDIDCYMQHHKEAQAQRLEHGRRTIEKLREADAAAVEAGSAWEEIILEIQFGM